MHKQLRSSKSDQKGFTIIEMLVVVAVIGFLASNILVYFKRARESAKDTILVNDNMTLAKSLDLYYQDHGQYPYPGNHLISSSDPAWDTDLIPALQPYFEGTISPAPSGTFIQYFVSDPAIKVGATFRISSPPGAQTLCLRNNSFAILSRLYDPIDNKPTSLWIDKYFLSAGGEDYRANYQGVC